MSGNAMGDTFKSAQRSKIGDVDDPDTDLSDEGIDLQRRLTAAQQRIRSLVELQIERTPNAIAVEFGNQAISYSELDSRANRIASRLIKTGVGPDKVVGICLERSIEMIVALLAIGKAGGAYVSLDPGYPRERLAFMVADAKPLVLMTTSQLLGHLPPIPGMHALCLDTQARELAEESSENPVNHGDADNLAYVIYTSGSTGQPKGVAMGQRVLFNLLEWQMSSWTPPAAARTLQFTSLNFDVSFQEIFSTLCAGGTLVLISEEMRRDPVALLGLIRDRAVERIFLPFVALQQLASSFEASQIRPTRLRDIITAGEQLKITPQIKRLLDHLGGCALHNQYGPAESHVVTAFTLRGPTDDWSHLPPIGRPVANARIYILDPQRRPVSEGSEGEIYIGGEALARGYLNREQLTAERFIADPFSEEADARLYQTGDRGRFLPDGNIQFLGRGDEQVKIRGMRVEVGEVEVVLAEHPAVFQAAVCAKEDGNSTKYLVAYFVPKTASPPNRDEVRNFLKAKLPPEFIPLVFVVMSAIPLTPSGKVDRLALTNLDEGSASTLYNLETRETKVPVNEVQTKLIEIWEALLGKRPIGIEDDFFDLGGHSLLAVQLTAEILKILGRTVTVPLIFKAPTVEKLAQALNLPPIIIEGTQALVEYQTSGTKPPFFCAPGFVDLARCLGPDQPFYGLNLSLIDQVSSVENGIQEWAGRCASEIRNVQPSGPYFLGGSTGAAGLVFELAHQLQAAGEPIGLLALFDPSPPPGSASRSPLRKVAFDLGYLFSLQWPEQKEYITSRVEKWQTYCLWRLRTLRDPAARRLRGIDASLRRSKRQGSLANIIQRGKALLSGKPHALPDSSGRPDSRIDSWYRLPSRLRAPVVVFLPHDSYLRDKPAEDPRRDWRHLVDGSFDVQEVPGRNSTYMVDPNAKIVAGLLQTYLESGGKEIANAWRSAVRVFMFLPVPWCVLCN